MSPIKRLENADFYMNEESETKKLQMIAVELDKDIGFTNKKIDETDKEVCKLKRNYSMMQEKVEKVEKKQAVSDERDEFFRAELEKVVEEIKGIREDDKDFYKKVFYAIVVALVANIVLGYFGF